MEFKTDALMLKAVDYGENDKMVTLLTADRGKIGAGMKGVKKANAKLRFAAQPFCFAEYVLAEKSGRHTVTSASLHDGFFPLREEIGKYYAATVVSEACDKLVLEGMTGGEFLVAAVSALEKMCGEETSFPLIEFLLTALRLAGYPVRAEALAVPFRESTREAGKRVGDVNPQPSAKNGGENPKISSPSSGGENPKNLPPSNGGENPKNLPSPACGGGVGEGARLFFDLERGAFSLERGTPASPVTYFAIREALGFPSPPREKEGEKRALRLLYSYFAYQTDSELTSLPEYIRLL